MAAIILTSLLTLAFIFIGQVNVLAPIVSINFMLTYSFIDYSYFSVAMTSKLRTKDEKDAPASAKANRTSSRRQSCRPLIEVTLPNYGSREHNLHLNGTLLEFAKDMDQIFPPASNPDAEQKSSPRQQTDANANVSTKQKLMDSFRLDRNGNSFSDEKRNELSASQTAAPAEEQQSKNSELCIADKMTAGESVRLFTSSSLSRGTEVNTFVNTSLLFNSQALEAKLSFTALKLQPRRIRSLQNSATTGLL